MPKQPQRLLIRPHENLGAVVQRLHKVYTIAFKRGEVVLGQAKRPKPEKQEK